MAKLTPKQQLFVQEYIIDFNATQAAIRAGYSQNTAQEIGSENLSKPIIADAVSRAFAERSQRTRIDQDWVLYRLQEIVERSMQHEEIMFEGGGTGIYRFNAAGANKALEMIGRHLGMFTDKVQADVNTGTGKLDEVLVQLRG